MAFKFITFIFFVLVLVSETTADECFDLGKCNGSSNDCNTRCQSKYARSVGSCYDSNKTPTCSCCFQTRMPRCYDNDGECDINCGDDCCMARCKAKYSDVAETTTGLCQLDGKMTYYHCMCTHYCDDHPPTVV